MLNGNKHGNHHGNYHDNHGNHHSSSTAPTGAQATLEDNNSKMACRIGFKYWILITFAQLSVLLNL